MKKIIAILAASALAFSANAQVFLGGSLGITYTGVTSKIDQTSTMVGAGYIESRHRTLITFTPTVGYRFNAKWSAGLDMDLTWNNIPGTYTNSGALEGIDISSRGFRWQVAPFARYNLFRIKKFGVDLKLSGHIGTTKTTATSPDGDFTANQTENILIYGASLKPVLSLDLNDHFSLEAILGIAGISWEATKDTYEKTLEDGGSDRPQNSGTETTSSFLFGLNNLSAISFGCIYKF